jgi:predicted ATP-dependent serine protease
MSSFKKTFKPSAGSSDKNNSVVSSSLASNQTLETVVTGVKPWVNTGLGIVSTGNKQLDDLVGGGQVLGTAVLLETDSFSTYGENLVLYGLAEGVSHQNSVLIISEDTLEAERLVNSIPYNQTVGSSSSSVDLEKASVQKKDHSNTLKIAWQYGKYLNKGKCFLLLFF